VIYDELPPRLLIVVGQNRVLVSREQPIAPAGRARLRTIGESARPAHSWSECLSARTSEQEPKGSPWSTVSAWRQARIDRCRSRAIGCDRAAMSAKSNEGRELFRKLASQWRALAGQIEFLNRLDRTAS
jgi:hypothetical protein